MLLSFHLFLSLSGRVLERRRIEILGQSVLLYHWVGQRLQVFFELPNTLPLFRALLVFVQLLPQHILKPQCIVQAECERSVRRTATQCEHVLMQTSLARDQAFARIFEGLLSTRCRNCCRALSCEMIRFPRYGLRLSQA